LHANVLAARNRRGRCNVRNVSRSTSTISTSATKTASNATGYTSTAWTELTGKNTHKTIHKQHQTYDPFANARGFKYTGALRASYPEIPVPRREIPSHIVLPDHAETGIPYAERKIRFLHKIDILTPAEIEAMRKVCKVPNPLFPLPLFWGWLTMGSWRGKC
jgi:hypothetical protein